MRKNKLVYSLISALASIILIFTLSGCSNTSKDASATRQPIAGAGTYKDYTPEAITSAASTDKVILFFHASWCPTCQSIERDIKAHLASIPSDVRILKVDYDNSKDLQAKYGVRQQYTMVQVDNTGKKLGLWTNSYSLQDILDSAK